jgi:hypothetical protein
MTNRSLLDRPAYSGLDLISYFLLGVNVGVVIMLVAL